MEENENSVDELGVEHPDPGEGWKGAAKYSRAREAALLAKYRGIQELAKVRYTFADDDDGHRYLVPMSQITEFEALVEAWSMVGDDEPSPLDPGELPGVVRVEGERWTFTDPREGGGS